MSAVIQLILCMLILAIDGLKINYAPDYCSQINESEKWDFIVVGAGSGGATVARRLSEIKDFQILLLEAGGNPPSDWNKIAGTQAINVPIEKYIWGYQSETSKNFAQGFKSPISKYFMAKTLGGSSSINNMEYMRDNRRSMDEWSKLGMDGWSYDEVLPFYKKTENFIAHAIGKKETNSTVSKKYHSKNGPLTIDTFKRTQLDEEISTAFLRASESIGFKYNIDPNGEQQSGFSYIQATIDKNGSRISTARAFLTKIPENLKICKNALVDKLILHGKTAKGVQFTYKGQSMQVLADKEVILSAGTFGTPAILERSGIGDRTKLREVGVKCIHNLPGVGENLQDHFIVYGNAFAIDAESAVENNNRPPMLTSITAFLNVGNASDDIPSTQLYFQMYDKSQSAMLLSELGLSDGIERNLRSYAYIRRAKALLTISPMILSQESRGNVHIRSGNPTELPKIEANALSTKNDISLMVKSLKIVEKLVQSGELKRFNIQSIPILKCMKYKYVRRDAYYECLTKTLANSGNHPVGTCAMGLRSKGGVTNKQLKVYGIKNLRIADGSVTPLITTGSPNAMIIMIGERAAHFIKEDYS